MRHHRATPAPSPPHPRVADHPPTDLKTVSFRCHNRSSARQPLLQSSQWHPRVAKRSSDRSLAQRPLPQVPQWHHRVTKGTSIGTLARRPSTEALLGQGHVPKERESVPLTGLWSGSPPGLARHPRLQVVLRQGRVAKRASIGTSARGPSTEALLGQGRVPKGRKSVPLAGYGRVCDRVRHGTPGYRWF